MESDIDQQFGMQKIEIHKREIIKGTIILWANKICELI